MFRDTLAPGITAPEDGTYWVHHYQHRTSHAVFIRAGEHLPECAVCHERVRYELGSSADDVPPLSQDKDLGRPPDNLRERA